MKKTITCIANILIYTLAASISLAQAQEQSKAAAVNSRNEASNSQFQFTDFLAQARPPRRTGFGLMPPGSTAAARGSQFSITPMALAANPQVFGSGTLGRLTKWTGFTSNSSVIGDSNIYEDKFGKVGIGTTAPTSLFTVQGVIETFGGIKFGDGTTQTTSTAGALFGVAHDATLQGNGTVASPLRVAVPLNLSGSSAATILNVVNSNGDGLRGASTDSAGVRGDSETSVGVRGDSVSGIGVLGQGLGNNYGVVGRSVLGTGVYAQGGSNKLEPGGAGLNAHGGTSSDVGGDGVQSFGAASDGGNGGDGVAAFGGGASGAGNNAGRGITAFAGPGTDGAAAGLAGAFLGNVQVSGTFSATGAKMFKIDHPLDPENKYLSHAAIESSEVLNIYSGNITTDQNGEATIGLPEWFEALNKDFRYQLTVIGTFAQAIVSDEIAGNRFGIKTSAPNVRVSWQLTGVRSDAGMKKYPFKTEEDKVERERGHYLTPEVFNQPEEKSIDWARHPEMMQKLKQQRLEAEDKIKKQQ